MTTPKRTKPIVVRLTAEERDSVRSRIPPDRNLSDYVRGALLDLPEVGRDPAETRPCQKRAPDPAKIRLAGEIARVGNNLNQIARAINETRRAGQTVSADSVIEELIKIRDEIAQLR